MICKKNRKYDRISRMLHSAPKKKKRLLIIASKFAWPESGASQQDCAQGVRDFLRLGFEVRMITHYLPSQKELLQSIPKQLGFKVTPIPYETRPKFFQGVWKEALYRATHPLMIDGATYEYAKPRIKQEMIRNLDEWKPDVVYFDFSFCWPLYPEIKKRNIPIITRAQNHEASQYLSENDITPSVLIKFIPKWLNEVRVAKWSDIFWAITPDEERIFRNLGARHTETLPLRSLPSIMREHRHLPKEKSAIDIVFLASTYHMKHNREAMRMVVTQIAPAALAAHPGAFKFHILGKHLEDSLDSYWNESVIQEGYVEDLQAFLEGMDVALCPSLRGHGMQQKVFEPLAIGIPTVTNRRALAGYPFENKKEVLLAENVSEFVDALGELRSASRRTEISKQARQAAEHIFSQDRYDKIILNALH